MSRLSKPKGDEDRRKAPNPLPADFLQRYGGRRGKQAVALMAAAQMLAPAAKWVIDKATERDDYTITVAGIDPVYPDLHEWVLERMPEVERKALIASTSAGVRRRKDDDDSESRPQVRLRYDGSRRQNLEIGGHKVVVFVEREDVPGRTNLPDNWRQVLEKITFTASTAGGRDAVVDVINGLLAAREEGPKLPDLFMPDRYSDGWTRRRDLPARPLDSVILKSGQLEHLVADLSAFLGAEEDYVETSQPWHRGYLFHGAPGTGKTSVARALANHFGLPTYYLPLGDPSSDGDLMSYVSSIAPRSVLLLEDIDVFAAATERADEDRKASLAALLNALDGVWTPHGLITVMTTNEKEELDPALIRAGRIDVDEEFSVLDADQAHRLAARFGAEDPEQFEIFKGRQPADLIGRLRQVRQAEIYDFDSWAVSEKPRTGRAAA